MPPWKLPPWEMPSNQREAIARKAAFVHAIPPRGEIKNLSCPDCGVFMKLLDSMYGRYYKCPTPGCPGKHGARADGTPSGIPGNVEVRAARREVMQALERLANICKTCRRDYKPFHDRFNDMWDGNPHIARRDVAVCKVMVTQIENLIRAAESTWFTLIQDGFLDEGE